MSSLIRLCPGDRSLDLVLALTVVVALASSAGWLISRRLAGNAALRLLVLRSALICCLASPAAAWFCAAAGLTLVSIPILRTERARIASGVTRMEIDPERTPPRPSTNPPPIGTDLPSPHPSTTTDTNSKVGAGPRGCSRPGQVHGARTRRAAPRRTGSNRPFNSRNRRGGHIRLGSRHVVHAGATRAE